MIQIDMDMPRSCFDCDLSFLYTNEGEIIGEYRCCLTNDNVDGLYSCRADNCPLKEAKPVIHAKYEQYGHLLKCSNCGKVHDVFDVEKWNLTHYYCYKCGAKMGDAE